MNSQNGNGAAPSPAGLDFATPALTRPEPLVAAAPSGPPPRRENPKAYSRLNMLTGWVLASIVLLSAIPAASNRPVFWMLWAAIVLVLGAVHLVAGAHLVANRRLRLADHLPPLLCFVAVAGFALVQAMPGLGALANPLPVPGPAQASTIAVAPQASLMGALRLMTYLVFFALVLEVASRPDRAERLAWAVFFGVAALTLYGLGSLAFLGDEYFWGEKTAYEGFATGTFINRNAFASFIGMGICLGLGLTLRRVRKARIRDSYGRHRKKRRLLGLDFLALAVLLLLMAITLVSTGSRTGMLASAVGAVIVFVSIELKSGVTVAKIALRIAAMAAILVVLVLPTYGLDLIWRFLFASDNSDVRLALYSAILEMIAHRPFLGFGFDGFEPAFEIFHGNSVQPELVWEYAHSSYLGNWLELGLVVGSLPLVAGALVGVRLFGHLRKRSSGIALPAVALGAICLLAIHATLDFTFEIQANNFLLLFLLAVGVASRAASETGRTDRAAEADEG